MRPTLTRTVPLVVSVVLLVAGALAVVEATHDFTGHCVGGNQITDGLFDPVNVTATVTDPLHLAAAVDPRRAAPQPGEQMYLVGGGIPEPGQRGVVVATDPVAAGELRVTITPSPVDGLPTLRPGARVRVTLETNRIGKTEAISADSLRPPPATVPGPATVWMGDGTGPMRPQPVTVTHIVGDRAVAGDAGPGAVLSGDRTPGTPAPIVVPDHHCRTAGVWPIVLQAPRHWSYPDVVEPG